MLDREAQKVHLRNLQEALGYLKNSAERRRQNRISSKSMTPKIRLRKFPLLFVKKRMMGKKMICRESA